MHASSRAEDIGVTVGDVAHPAEGDVVATTLCDVQEADVQAGAHVHWHFKLQADVAQIDARQTHALIASHNLQTDVCCDAAVQLGHLPGECLVVLAELERLSRRRELVSTARGLGQGPTHDNVCAVALWRNIRVQRQDDVRPAHAAAVLEGHSCAEGQRILDLASDAVVHGRELAIGRAQHHDAVRLKLRQVDALVEVAVVQQQSVCSAALANDEVVVEAHGDVRGALQEALHLDAAVNLCAQDAAGRAEEDGEALQDVDEDLVLAVLLVLEAQGNRLVGRGAGHAPARVCPQAAQERAALVRLDDGDGLVVDKGLEHLRRGRLAVSKVDGLVEELVNEDKVDADALLGQHAAVVLEDVGDTRQELEDHGWGHVELCRADKEQAVALDVDKVDPFDIKDRRRVAAGPGLVLAEEDLRCASDNVAAVVLGNHRVSARRQDEELRDHSSR
eukprot:m.78484 g.78484  ORF g.78484 m.78484 type:complete len:448 (+) comp14750_c0_seq1:297-1640(+)